MNTEITHNKQIIPFHPLQYLFHNTRTDKKKKKKFSFFL